MKKNYKFTDEQIKYYDKILDFLSDEPAFMDRLTPYAKKESSEFEDDLMYKYLRELMDRGYVDFYSGNMTWEGAAHNEMIYLTERGKNFLLDGGFQEEKKEILREDRIKKKILDRQRIKDYTDISRNVLYIIVTSGYIIADVILYLSRDYGIIELLLKVFSK